MTTFTPPAYLFNNNLPAMLDRGTLGTSTPMYIHQQYLDGHAETVGSVEEVGGHWYKVDRYLVMTDSQGFTYCFEYATWMDADVIFENVQGQIERMNADLYDQEV